MVVSNSTLARLISPTNNGKFIIPVYQRNYAWKQEYCDQLFADILSLTDPKKQHFLGTITYITHRVENASDFMVIDGQQRITTIMLLLKALQLVPSAIKNDEIQKTIHGYLYGVSGDETRVRLKPIKKDREAFECVMKYDGKQSVFSSLPSFKSSRVVENFKFFRAKIKEKKLKDETILQMLYAFNRLQIAEVVLDKTQGDDPQLVFERINAEVQPLKGLDLIRNFLMMVLEEYEQERIYNDFWLRLEGIFSDERENETIISKFITAYLRIYCGKNLQEKEKVIYKEFKELREQHFDNSSEKILIDMLKFARIYKVIINENARQGWQYKNETLKEKLILREKISIINYLNFNTAYPFLMQLIDDFKNSRLDFENFNEILGLLISYLVRRVICNLPTNALNSVLYGIYKKIKSEYKNISAENVARHLGQKVGSERFPDIVTLRLGFENTPIKIKNVVKLVLCEIEKKLGNSEVPERDSLSIEHFYPKAAREEWRKIVGGEEKIRQMEDTYVETFGNLTLLEPGLNSKAGNKSFNDKLMVYEDESSLRLNSYFSNCEKWDIDEIKKRARRLCEIFVEIDIFKDIKSELRPTRNPLRSIVRASGIT